MNQRRNTGREGFSLVEVALALGVAAFCLLAIFGLLPLGVTSNQQASRETEATGILSSVIADLRACPSPLAQGSKAVTPLYAIAVPTNPVLHLDQTTVFFGDSQDATAAIAADSRYRMVVSFHPNDAGIRSATLAHLQIFWPPAAESPTGMVETLIALDRN